MPIPTPSVKTVAREPTILTIERPPPKNIEIYATLPKNKKGLLSRATKVKNTVEDEEYLMYDRPGRSLYSSRSKLNGKKDGEKRARSEERNNKTSKDKEFVSNSLSKEAKKQAKSEEPKQNKKQHKIRRKLLMGGLIRRKNRSMPDLREDESTPKEVTKNDPKTMTKDDSSVGSKMEKQMGLSGYLSEGHLEFSGNPNLERSKLMRKSFHGSKILQMAKVPPPPPLRTTSQLSKTDRPQFPLPMSDIKQNIMSEDWSREPQSLPFIPASYSETKKIESVTYANGGFLLQGYQQPTKVVTTAQVHQEQSPQAPTDSTIQCDVNGFPLPPYPSPLNSVTHSRQASEDFPPPPPPEIISQELDEPLVRPPSPESLLAQVQQKRLQILAENEAKAAAAAEAYEAARAVGGETWLRELQAKQAALKGKNGFTQNTNKNDSSLVTGSRTATSTKPGNAISHYESRDRLSSPVTHEIGNNQQISSVKDLKSRFEKIKLEDPVQQAPNKPPRASPIMDSTALYDAQVSNNTMINSLMYDSSLISAHMNGLDISHDSSKAINEHDITFGSRSPIPGKQQFDSHEARRKSGKKKNVTFCEQVVLVATADEDEVDSYIPNPILERVLRSVLHKDSPQEVRETTIQSVIPLKRTDSGNYGQKHQNESLNQNIPSINSTEKLTLQNQDNFTYQVNSSSNLSTLSLNDLKNQPLPNGDILQQDHQQRYFAGQQHSVKPVQQSPVMARPINQVQMTKQNSAILSNNHITAQNNFNTHQTSNYSTHSLQSPQQIQNSIQNQQSQNILQNYSQQQTQSHLQYYPQSNPHLHSTVYYPQNSHINQTAETSHIDQSPSEYFSGQQMANPSYQSIPNPQILATSSPYQHVPTSQSHLNVSANSPYQQVPQSANQFRSGVSVSQASLSQTQGLPQQSPMMGRQLNHHQFASNHSHDGRKVSVVSSSPINMQHRVNENTNHCQGDTRYIHQTQNYSQQQIGSGSLRSQHNNVSGEQHRFVNNPPVHQHTTVRARPQAMYQQDFPPPEYQHPPPPRKDFSNTNGLPPRSDIYQRVPNPAGNVPVDSSSQGNSSPANCYTYNGVGNQRPLSPIAANSQCENLYQYPLHNPYQQHNGQAVYHQVSSSSNNHALPQHTVQNHVQQPNYNQQHSLSTNPPSTQILQHAQHTTYNQQHPQTASSLSTQVSQATPTPVRHSPYQPPPHPKQMEAASRGVQPAGLSHLRSNPCNLCRKKQVQHPAIYCTDCDFYMSRFKPKT